MVHPSQVRGLHHRPAASSTTKEPGRSQLPPDPSHGRSSRRGPGGHDIGTCRRALELGYLALNTEPTTTAPPSSRTAAAEIASSTGATRPEPSADVICTPPSLPPSTRTPLPAAPGEVPSTAPGSVGEADRVSGHPTPRPRRRSRRRPCPCRRHREVGDAVEGGAHPSEHEPGAGIEHPYAEGDASERDPSGREDYQVVVVGDRLSGRRKAIFRSADQMVWSGRVIAAVSPSAPRPRAGMSGRRGARQSAPPDLRRGRWSRRGGRRTPGTGAPGGEAADVEERRVALRPDDPERAAPVPQQGQRSARTLDADLIGGEHVDPERSCPAGASSLAATVEAARGARRRSPPPPRRCRRQRVDRDRDPRPGSASTAASRSPRPTSSGVSASTARMTRPWSTVIASAIAAPFRPPIAPASPFRRALGRAWNGRAPRRRRPLHEQPCAHERAPVRVVVSEVEARDTERQSIDPTRAAQRGHRDHDGHGGGHHDETIQKRRQRAPRRARVDVCADTSTNSMTRQLGAAIGSVRASARWALGLTDLPGVVEEPLRRPTELLPAAGAGLEVLRPSIPLRPRCHRSEQIGPGVAAVDVHPVDQSQRLREPVRVNLADAERNQSCRLEKGQRGQERAVTE